MRVLLFILSGTAILTSINAHADNFGVPDLPTVKSYDFSAVSIPDTVGATTNDLDGNAFIYSIHYSETMGATLGIKVNGTLLGDGKTYATNNPGVGIQYTLHLMNNAGLSPTEDIKAPPFTYTAVGHGTYAGIAATVTMNVWYRLVRVGEAVPPGPITTVPDVTYVITNPAGEGDPMLTGTIISGIGKQPKVVACTINAPAEIKLNPLYGSDLVTGAQNIYSVPSIQLSKCPGAINSIAYKLHAVYGMHDANNGVLNVETGTGYANNVYVQVQNDDTTAYSMESEKPFNYTGAGDYSIPSFNVAYYIDNINNVTPGNVKSAVEVQISYN